MKKNWFGHRFKPNLNLKKASKVILKKLLFHLLLDLDSMEARKKEEDLIYSLKEMILRLFKNSMEEIATQKKVMIS